MKKLLKITLLVTEDCNLNCVYCYQHHKVKKQMNFETAVSIIDNELSCEYESALISFLGGEPFLNYKLIRQVVEYVSNRYHNVSFSAFTNGTLIKGVIAEWLESVRDKFDLILSMDGKKKYHDCTRIYKSGKGSFDDIELEMLKNKIGIKEISLTISENNIDGMSDNIQWIQENGFHCQSLFALGVHWNKDILNKHLGVQMKKLVDYYINNPEQQLCLFLRYDFNRYDLDIPDDFSICRIGNNPTYTPDGKRSLCTGMSEITIGDDASRFSKWTASDFSAKKMTCGKCRYAFLCSGVKMCYVSNYQATGDFFSVSSEQCYINKVCIWASALIKLHQLKNIPGEYESDLTMCKKIINEITQNLKCNDIENVYIGG